MTDLPPSAHQTPGRLILVSFDIDGTLEAGQPPGPVTFALVAAAKARGLPITCAVSAHHLTLNELDVGSYYTFRKVKPPLRSEADRNGMVEGVASGAVDAIVSSHDPQAAATKRQTFAHAAFGAVGLETLLPAALTVHHNGHASLSHVLATMTTAPARILGLDSGRLVRGAPADLVLCDLAAPRVIDAAKLTSKSKNSAFDGRRLQGEVLMTLVDGRVVYEAADA